MNRLIAGATLLLLWSPLSALAEERVARLASGIEGGTYHDLYARRINEKVEGWRFENRATRGSTDNLDLLSTGEADVALAQADVFASRILEEPDVFGELVVLGGLAEECVFVAGRKGGAAAGFGALAEPVGERAAIINLGPRQSGMAESWNYICSLMPEQSEADIDNSDSAAGFDKLAAGEIEAVAWVTSPSNPNHKLTKIARDDERFDFLSVNDPRLGSRLSDGLRVYKVRKVPIPGSSGTRSVETACTTTLLVVGPEADPDLVYAISEALFDSKKKSATEPAK
jgi:TRAP-type uncharacterized transport system substrate-binding protein